MGGSEIAGYLLDTHVWIWFLQGSEDLHPGLRRRIEESSAHCWLSPISVWEASSLIRKGKIGIDGSFRTWIDRVFELLPLRDARLSREIAALSHELDLPHRDPADRFLAATTLIYDLTLLTVDERLTSQQWLPTLSR